jgi:hypothetical protein
LVENAQRPIACGPYLPPRDADEAGSQNNRIARIPSETRKKSRFCPKTVEPSVSLIKDEESGRTEKRAHGEWGDMELDREAEEKNLQGWGDADVSVSPWGVLKCGCGFVVSA